MAFGIDGFIDEALADAFIGIPHGGVIFTADRLGSGKITGIALDDDREEFAFIAFVSDQTMRLIAVEVDTVTLIEDFGFAFHLNFEFSAQNIVKLLTGMYGKGDIHTGALGFGFNEKRFSNTFFEVCRQLTVDELVRPFNGNTGTGTGQSVTGKFGAFTANDSAQINTESLGAIVKKRDMAIDFAGFMREIFGFGDAGHLCHFGSCYFHNGTDFPQPFTDHFGLTVHQ